MKSFPKVFMTPLSDVYLQTFKLLKQRNNWEGHHILTSNSIMKEISLLTKN